MQNKPEPEVALGERLREIRKKKGLSREDLAGLLGVHLSTVGQYERGSGALDALGAQKLCEAHNINISWLLSGQGAMTGPERAAISYTQPEAGVDYVEESQPPTRFGADQKEKKQYPSSLSATNKEIPHDLIEALKDPEIRGFMRGYLLARQQK